MKIKLYSTKDIRDEGALPVTSSNFFKNNVPDPDGLFSPIIFGITPDEKVKKVGRINLRRKIIHPLIYTRIFERSFRKIDSLVRGDEKFSVVGGKLVSDPEKGKTGMDFFISVMDDLNLYNGLENEEDSLITKKLKESMKNLNKDDILIDQWLVTPLAYRDLSTLDVDLSAIDESNNLYRDLISLCDYYENAKTQPLVNLNSIIYKIQLKANVIFEYFEGMTFKKFGIQNKLVLARNIDYSSRLVISAAKFDANNYGTNWVRFDTAGVPLSAVAANGVLFALHHSEKVLEDLYNSGGFEANQKLTLDNIKKDYFNREVIAEMIDHYCSSWGERINYVNVPGTDEPIKLKYKDVSGKEVTKPLTLLEFVYMLVYVPIEVGQRCVMCRRYPIQGAFSIISLKTHVLSIESVHPISFMGQEFPYFPNSASMEKELKESKNVSLDNMTRAMKAGHLTTMYNETLVLSNLLMEGYNMDFDGDKLAVSLLLTEEANREALNFLKDPQSVFTLDGKNYRVILNKESISGLYGMTLENPKAKPIPEELVKEIVESKDFNMLSAYILDTFEDGKIKSAKYSIESPCVFSFKNKKYKTTLGRAFFNYNILSDLDSEFVNATLNKKEQSKILETQDAICLSKMREGDYTYFENVFLPFLNKWEEFVFTASDLFSPSIDMDIYATTDEYDRFRAKLIADNREALEAGNLEVYDDIEKQVTAKLKETTKADTRIFDSGSKLSFGGDLRNGLVCIGPMPIGVGAGKYAISASSLMEGTKKDERHLHAQSNIVAGYFRAMGPAVGGEIGKEIMAAFHDVKLDKKGSDCGRMIGQWYTINSYLAEQLDLRYMIQPNGKLEQLTTESMKTKYMGKPVHVRSVHFCKNKDFCSICSGETPYLIAKDNEVNIGAQKSKTGDEITQASLSKFHSSKTQFVAVNFNDYIVPANVSNYELKQKNLQEVSDILFELSNIDYMLKLVESDEFLEEIADDIDEVLDDTILKNHEEFDEFVENEITLDVHKLAVSKADLNNYIEDIKKRCGRIIKIVMDNFNGTKLNDTKYLNILNTLNHLTIVQSLDTIIGMALRNDDDRYPFLSSVNDDKEYPYYRMYINIIKIPRIDIDLAGLPEKMTQDIHATFWSIANQIQSNINGYSEKLDYEVTYSYDDEAHYIFLEPNFILLYDSLPEDTSELIEEGIILDSATKAKLDKKIKSSNNNIRKRYESAILKAVGDANIQRKRARDNIGETVKEKSARYESDLRHAKDEYRKTLANMMQDFELNFLKKNKFKMLKLRNKLNFIFNKKSTTIDSQLSDNIKELKKKMYNKMKENENKLKDKYGV